MTQEHLRVRSFFIAERTLFTAEKKIGLNVNADGRSL